MFGYQIISFFFVRQYDANLQVLQVCTVKVYCSLVMSSNCNFVHDLRTTSFF